jgi:hypothetical protein
MSAAGIYRTYFEMLDGGQNAFSGVRALGWLS